MFLVEQIVIRNMEYLTTIMYFQHITLVVIISLFFRDLEYSEKTDDVFVLVLLIVTHADKKVLVYCKVLTTTSEHVSVKLAVSP